MVMSVTDVVVMIGSMLLTFLVGGFGVLLIGGRTSLNYLLVKVSHGKKVLLMVKTSFGWKSFVGTKNESTVLWKIY